MNELKNEFSWSKTRDEVFRTCPRQYWFSYYGCWSGWFENAPERTRQIYVLKSLKNRYQWAGERVHECIQRSLNNVRRGIKTLPVDDIVSITLDQMRAEFRSSKAKNYWKHPKSCGLFEHEYEVEVCDEEWKGVASLVETCLRNFYASDIYDGLKSHRKKGWLEVGEFSSFNLDHGKINLVIDCAIREGEGVYIYDWKTRQSPSEDFSVQLGCYALYAAEKWDVSPESLSVIEYNLSADRSNWFSVSQEVMKGGRTYLNGSIKDMHSLLVDIPNNLPMEEDRFSRVEDEGLGRRCNYRRVCRK